jgi:hypothetical protein
MRHKILRQKPYKRKRICKKLKPMRKALYTKMDIRLNRLRYGLKDLIMDIYRLRYISRTTFPQSPIQRYK